MSDQSGSGQAEIKTQTFPPVATKEEELETLSTRKLIQQLLNSQDLDGDVLISVRGGEPALSVVDVDFDEDGNTVLNVQ